MADMIDGREPSNVWLVSLPVCMRDAVERGACSLPEGVVCGADPVGEPLGSGGGTVHLLKTAAEKAGVGLEDWLQHHCSLVLHGGGQSRRLPAYAAVGKPFVPVPVFRWSMGQRLDQSLFDLQQAFVEDLLKQASDNVRLVITSGDVLLQAPTPLPPLPDADVVMVGMHARPEDACRFGVLFCDRSNPARLRRFLQKPSADEIRRHSEQTSYFVDCGLWLLSARAVQALLGACGWSAESGRVMPFDLYGEWGPCFGEDSGMSHPALEGLTVAVAPIPGGAFHHFGRTLDVVDAVYELQNPVQLLGGAQHSMHAPHPRQFVQNASFSHPLGLDRQACIWVENACVPASWRIRDHHMLTNIPDNDWSLDLPSGICLDMPPILGGGRALRLYGMEDAFRGRVSDPSTLWLGQPLSEWLTKRNISLTDAGILDDVDIQDAALFPVATEGNDFAALLGWMLDAGDQCDMRTQWLTARRVSASDLLRDTDVAALLQERRTRMFAILPVLARQRARNMLYRLDLAHFGRLWNEAGLSMASLPDMGADLPALQKMHGFMLRSDVAARYCDASQAAEAESAAFKTLRDEVLASILANPVDPVCALLEDQIVWGRSPARLDLAGGWSDTPPYCLENGGAVLNMAVNLNGQPPVQVFGRLLTEPKLVIRSIDLGLSEELHEYADVENYHVLGSGFAVARAAFALAGFAPGFCAKPYDSLQQQLTAFGGGIELSMLAAIPKGSGLGTSSILAATLLGVLGNLAGLAWDLAEISRRTLALEQMLTSGGGWQDQIGGIYGGVKLIETSPGLTQEPTLRWAPESFFGQPEMASRLLLYYTGITRVAHNILGEIVRGIFLNSRRHLDVIDAIRLHAGRVYQSLLQNDIDAVGAGLAESWRLNQALDAGTNVPDVAALLDRCGGALAGCKLAGAGGGGFLLMQAKDADAAVWIREHLKKHPPNSRARFVDISISSAGLEITRS